LALLLIEFLLVNVVEILEYAAKMILLDQEIRDRVKCSTGSL